MQYSRELKESITRRMLPPNNEAISKISKEEGISEQIQAWKDACINANGGVAQEAARLNKELKVTEKEKKRLEKECSIIFI
ncbi:MAG: hypothetical protein ABRQ25_04885 [Clostridiaceae bacterium]